MNESKDDTTFEIGLVMAGAVSAGAYTGGVVDFLMEALSTWEQKKLDGDSEAPRHKVQIKVVTGASAGAITAAVLGSSLRDKDYPLPLNHKPSALYKTWVTEVDIKGLLDNSDLVHDAPVRSLLNSNALVDIANDVLAQDWTRTNWPNYLSNPVQFFFTVTNLRGIPHAIQFASDGGGGEYNMSMHADYMHFTLSPTEINVAGLAKEVGITPPSAALALGTKNNINKLEGNWDIFKRSALASGAFPVGLAAQPLERTGTTAYDKQLWAVTKEPPEGSDGKCQCTDFREIPPDWPKEIDTSSFTYEFVNVDGGVANNEPFEIARQALTGQGKHNSPDPKQSNRAVLMIDPFPTASTFDTAYKPADQLSLLKVLPTLLSAVVSQLRFKPEELVLARDPKNFSRWLISPRRRESTGKLAKFPIACGGLGGFGGFFAEDFRKHDYQLGRRNAQKFLKETFVLHEDNRLFSQWTDVQKRQFAIQIQGEDGCFLPIIPTLAEWLPEEPQPAWPAGTMTEERYKDISRRMDKRADKLFGSINTPAIISSWWERRLLGIGWNILKWRRLIVGGSITDPIVDIIRKDMTERGL